MTQLNSSLDIKIREESPDDVLAISRVTAAAFLAAPHTSHTEEFVVGALRRHVAISPTAISGNEVGWYGLGPVSVLPSYQRRGIGSALIMDALLVLSSSGAAGCVVLGDPAFYERFGFSANAALTLPGFPPQNLLAVAFDTSIPKGVVSYHEAFQARS
jgi:predicted N-acetyltransferase YhbS